MSGECNICGTWGCVEAAHEPQEDEVRQCVWIENIDGRWWTGCGWLTRLTPDDANTCPLCGGRLEPRVEIPED